MPEAIPDGETDQIIPLDNGILEECNYNEAVNVGIAYAVILRFDCKRVRESLIVILNTHATQTLTYQIFGSAKFGNKQYPPDSTDDSWVNLIKYAGDLVAAGEKTLAANNEYVIETMSNTYAWMMIKMKGSGVNTTAKIWHRGQS